MDDIVDSIAQLRVPEANHLGVGPAHMDVLHGQVQEPALFMGMHSKTRK